MLQIVREMAAEGNNHLVFAMMHFLEKELLRSDLTPDAKESLEGIRHFRESNVIETKIVLTI